MTDEQRSQIAAVFADELARTYRGNKKRAYTAADVNPATFDRILDGLKVRPDRMAHRGRLGDVARAQA